LFQSDAILLANAFNHLEKNILNVKLLHIGNSKYSLFPYIKNTNALVETGSIKNDDLHIFLSSCDIFWLPLKNTLANQGRFPLKFTDYISHGRPIICTDVGDIPYFIKKCRIGFVTKDEPEKISLATIQLIKNPTLMKSMGNNALELANDPKHSWLSRANDLLSFYNQTL
jgi:glycosyltransferase involved in cell wall biosynthesis